MKEIWDVITKILIVAFLAVSCVAVVYMNFTRKKK